MLQALWKKHAPNLKFNIQDDLESHCFSTIQLSQRMNGFRKTIDFKLSEEFVPEFPTLLKHLFLISRRFEIPFNEIALGLTDGPEKTLISSFINYRNFDLKPFIEYLKTPDNCRSMINTLEMLFTDLYRELAIKLFEKRVEDIPPQLLHKWLEAELMQGRQIFSTLPLAEIQTQLRNGGKASDLTAEETPFILGHQLFKNPALLKGKKEEMQPADLAQWILPLDLYQHLSFLGISPSLMRLKETGELTGFNYGEQMSPEEKKKARLYEIALRRVLQDGKLQALTYSPNHDVQQSLEAIKYLQENAEDNILWCNSSEMPSRKAELTNIAEEYFMGAFFTLKRFDIPVQTWSHDLVNSEMGSLVIDLMKDKLDFVTEFKRIVKNDEQNLARLLDAYNTLLANIEAHLKERLQDLQSVTS